MSVAEWKQKQIPELKQVLTGLLREQFKLRLQKSTDELKEVHKFKQVRRDIARLMTLLAEKQKKEKGKVL